jgi:hypothetical protein
MGTGNHASISNGTFRLSFQPGASAGLPVLRARLATSRTDGSRGFRDFAFLASDFGQNPFGHSGRRIADFYAGLVGDFRSTQKWKRLRRTKHDHHPVHDALGNAEALIRIFDGER